MEHLPLLFQICPAGIESRPLGLEVTHGRWRERPRQDGLDAYSYGLSAISCDGQLVGFEFHDPDDRRNRLLLFSDRDDGRGR